MYPGPVCSRRCWWAQGLREVEPHKTGIVGFSAAPGTWVFYSPAAPRRFGTMVPAHEPCLGWWAGDVQCCPCYA